jgi:hypothetical protein
MVEEWLRNPVTEAVEKILDLELERAVDLNPMDCYVEGDPQQTQDRIARLLGKIDALTEYLPLFDKEFLLSEVADLEQLQRDKS